MSRRSLDTLYSVSDVVNSLAHFDAVSPTATDDSTLGYVVGQLWVKTGSPRIVYILVDDTEAAAVWRDITVQLNGALPPVTSTSTPTVDDDITEGYSKGQIWIRTTTDTAFLCVNNDEGVAIWLNLSASGGLPSGGTLYQALSKLSSVDADAGWRSSGLLTAKSSGSVVTFVTDFFEDTDTAAHTMWTPAAMSSGTATVAPADGDIDGDHPGVVLLRTSATANSGYRYQIADLARIRLTKGAISTCILKVLNTNAKLRFGWSDSITGPTAPTDGAYIFVSDEIAYGVCRQGGTETATVIGESYTLTLNTWYMFVVEVNSDATEVKFSVVSMAGSELWTRTIATNIPSASGQNTSHGIVVWDAGTTARDMIAIDFMSMSYITGRPVIPE